MMGRLNPDQEQLCYSFRLPHDHPVRKIAAVLDLSWVHSELRGFPSQLIVALVINGIPNVVIC
jgi:hypothetical protein